MAAKKQAKPAAAGAKRRASSSKKPSGASSRARAASKPAKATSAQRARPGAGGVAKRAVSKPAAPAPGAGVHEGDTAPSFELADEAGAMLSSRDLVGKPYVLYFYPKDDTPGCTSEACGFRDALPEFEKLGVRVIGVSPDSSASHERFRTKYALPFSLLSDADKQLSSAYGAWALKKNYGKEYMGVVRSTFLVDGTGVIRKTWRGVKVNGHVEQVQAAAATLG